MYIKLYNTITNLKFKKNYIKNGVLYKVNIFLSRFIKYDNVCNMRGLEPKTDNSMSFMHYK